MEYDEIVLETFLKNQGKLFDENVAETLEEAKEFLEDCMAVVVESLDEVRELSDEELKEELEVFEIPDGRYLVVEA